MEIRFDRSTITKPTDRSWQVCVGSDHACQVHRSDFQEQMTFVHNELGFRYIRFHGILADDMNIVQSLSDLIPLPGATTIRTTNFFQVGRVYDAVLKAGMKPFVELSFMPSALASGRKTVFHNKSNITPPKDMNAWSDLIKQFIRFLLDRYGEQEVERWYFEVWNEPNVPIFWSGGQKGYFNLYKATVLAIKSVNPRLRVGGPATSANCWLKEFQAYCKTENLPFDFLSSHHYPDNVFAFAFSVDAKLILKAARLIWKSKGESIAAVNRKFFWETDSHSIIPKSILTDNLRIAKKEAGGVPLLYTEWNCSSTYGAPIHDTKLSAAFALKTILDNDGLVSAYSFWCFSDLFEESFFLAEPFNGGFGLLTVDGIPKPSFWAFKLLSMLGDKRYDFHFELDGVEAAAFKKGERIQILLYHQSFMEQEGKKQPVRLILPGIASARSVTLEAIDEEHCNPKRVWEEMGSPSVLKSEDVESIKARSSLQAFDLPFEFKDGTLAVDTAIEVNDIQLITVQL